MTSGRLAGWSWQAETGKNLRYAKISRWTECGNYQLERIRPNDLRIAKFDRIMLSNTIMYDVQFIYGGG